MPVPDCIDRDELRAFSLGRVDDDRVEQINAHLVECPVCEDTIASFDDTADSLIASVREAARDDGPESHSAASSESRVLQDALARSLGRMPGSTDESNGASASARVVERIRDYELVEQLGAGGMGTVYRALHT